MSTSAASSSGFLDIDSTGANFTGAHTTGAVAAFIAEPFKASHANSAPTTAAGAIMHASKIGDLPLFATVGARALAAVTVWLIAVVGLSPTIKSEYLHTFVSLQAGYAYSQSYFLDNPGQGNASLTDRSFILKPQ